MPDGADLEKRKTAVHREYENCAHQ
jgi:hypothetical protein